MLLIKIAIAKLTCLNHHL